MLVAMLLAVAQVPVSFTRDAYGVPVIRAANASDAFFQAGYAVAEDRLWQMELSRRVARGRMAEVFGAEYANSDREIRRTGYTEPEIAAQIDRLQPATKLAYTRYVDGINAYLRAATLPEGYAKAGFTPEPWTVLDSAAITIRLLQQFGQGGAGEIRNLAMLSYLQGRPNLKDRSLDVFDDLAWQNDPTATPTQAVKYDTRTPKPRIFGSFDRKTTEAQLAAIPKLSLFDLLPAVSMASREASTLVAEKVGAPYKWGSYAIVIGGKRSAIGRPILLNGPQMGHQTPSIVHEIAFDVPGMRVAGMDCPGVPGVLVGMTPKISWGLTSGVADTDDIFWYPSTGAKQYRYGDQEKAFAQSTSVLKVKGKPDEQVERLTTDLGPVVLLKPNKLAFVRASPYRNLELTAMDGLMHMYTALESKDVDAAMGSQPMNFNLFFATASGHIGWRYLGHIPLRADGLDPRLPAQATPATAWHGIVPKDQMPRLDDPSDGLIANWNNKPASWWPNGDTPVWGRVFRNSALLGALDKPKLNAQDAEFAAWTIARTDETWPYFSEWVADSIPGFDGRTLDGSRQAGVYAAFLDALRKEIFSGATGDFASPANFRQITQPTLMLRALEKRTKFPYLSSRKPQEVVAAALRAAESAPPYRAGAIRVTGQAPIPYGNRGTYIQVIEMLTDGPYGRNVASPGVSERGDHAFDQAPLARSWTYKPMIKW